MAPESTDCAGADSGTRSKTMAPETNSGTEEELLSFVNILNHNDINMKLTCKYSQTEIEFLDILIRKGESNILETDVFRKETAVNSLLHASSSHPQQVVNAIPTGQFLQVKRICSNDYLFNRQADELAERFRSRGYSNRSIKKGWRRAAAENRINLMQPKEKKKEQYPMIRFISTYNERWRDMRQALNKYWAILKSDQTLTRHISDTSSITYRRSKNLKDILVHSYYPGGDPNKAFGSKGPKWGFFPCNDCIACPNMQKASGFESSDGTKNFTITQHITCNSIGVIYYAKCPCGKIYVGLTSRPLRLRVREHVRDILNAREVTDMTELKPIPRHFKQIHDCNAKLLKVSGIDKVFINQRGCDWKKILAQLETRWIKKIDCVYPKGLNEKLSFAPFL
ncbi:unnamed protein product [Ranitomeya imitator]|uniref:Helix-turn-helix domain-containing protein n=1 Tax=Ranitomeya imitator TaxID=111125 RepID=A0ABN9LVW1_9NEOB|nr:unnamed protein product [Ranitomeya imitator]